VNAPGNIFVFVIVAAFVGGSIISLMDRYSKPAKIKERYKNEIEMERKALSDQPEKFEAWLSHRQYLANKDKESTRNQITIWITVPIALVVGSAILAWMYSS
jgi:hypothetical protein